MLYCICNFWCEYYCLQRPYKRKTHLTNCHLHFKITGCRCAFLDTFGLQTKRESAEKRFANNLPSCVSGILCYTAHISGSNTSDNTNALFNNQFTLPNIYDVHCSLSPQGTYNIQKSWRSAVESVGDIIFNIK